MLAQLASLASLARVRPLITHQAYQLAGGLGFPSTLDFSGQNRKKDKLLSLGVLGKYSLSVSFVMRDSFEKDKCHL